MTADEANKATALEQEKNEKKILVKKILEARCIEASEFKNIKDIGDGIKDGDSLELKVLSGGETNFSYKAYLRNDPSKALFAKLTFTKALWNPDPTIKYDLSRVDSEFKIMNQFAEMMGGYGTAPVAQPFFVIDLDPADNKGQDAKLLVAEWSRTDEQFANQFADGAVDSRVITGLAVSLGKLNLTPVEYEWNEDCRGCFRSLHPVVKQVFAGFVALPEDQSDAAVQRCKELGLPALEKMIDNLDVEYMESRQVLNHNDTKQFNILVEPKSDDGLSFGERGDFALCDWEMTIKGKSGKDIGVFWAYALACSLCHAAHGNEKKARHILSTCMTFWNKYAEFLVQEGNKDEAFLIDTLRGAFGGAFLYLFVAHYAFGLHVDAIPFEGLSMDMSSKAKGAMGLVGLFLAEESYGENKTILSLENLKKLFENRVSAEINNLLKIADGFSQGPAMKHQRRESNRRASDVMMMEEALKRMSAKADGRASIYGLVIPDAALLEDEE